MGFARKDELFAGVTIPRIWVLVFLSLSLSAHAEIVWKGDFSTGNFSQYIRMQCGADEGAESCPGGNQSHPGRIDDFPVVTCVNEPDCRFLLLGNAEVPAPAPGASSAYRPAGNALRVRVHPAPPDQDPTTSGDNGWRIGRPWGSDHRNELVLARDTAAGQPDFYTQNDEAYYGFSVYIPRDGDPGGDFPNPPASYDFPRWHLVFQFHATGACDDGGPPLFLALMRTDTASGTQQGSEWQWVLFKRDTYHADSTHTPPRGYVPTKSVGQDGNYRLWPWNNTRNANPSLASNLEKGRWHTFVLRVVWSTCDGQTIPCRADQKKGELELWVDGVKKYPVPSGNGPGRDPKYRPTLYTYPAPNAEGVYRPASAEDGTCALGLQCLNGNGCEEPGWAQGAPIPVYLKLGLYRDRRIPNIETLYHADLLAATERAQADPLTRGRLTQRGFRALPDFPGPLASCVPPRGRKTHAVSNPSVAPSAARGECRVARGRGSLQCHHGPRPGVALCPRPPPGR